MNKKPSSGCMFIVALVAIMPMFVLACVIGYKAIQFDRHCEGHLKRAADANTVELARTELATAITYLEDNNLTEGYTSIIYTEPSEDIGFWYSNLVASREELDKVNEKTPQLERSNVLMKLRETLLDDTQSGTEVTCPSGISRYPNNTAFAIALVGCGILFLLGVFCGRVALTN